MKNRIFTFFLVLSCVSMMHGQIVTNAFTNGLNVGDKIEKGIYTSSTDPVVKNQWTAWSKDLKTAGNEIDPNESPVAASPLVYAGYIDSNTSNSIALQELAEDEIRMSTFSIDEAANPGLYPTTGTYYLAFMLNVSKSAEDIEKGANVISFNRDPRGNWQTGILTTVKVNESEFKFGIAERLGEKPTLAGKWYKTNETHLIVMKYSTVGSARTISLMINPTAERLSLTTEPVSTEYAMSFTLTNTTQWQYIKAISMFQRLDFAAKVGGIRFAKTWEGLIKEDVASGLSLNPGAKEILKTQYFNLSGIEIKQPQEHQIYIKKLTYDDGSSLAKKTIFLNK